MFRQINRLFRDVEDELFEDIFVDGQAIVAQVEQFAERHSIQLGKGWKVDVAKGVKQKLQKGKSDVVPDPDEYMSKWLRLFEKFNG